jgi:hypothetical protein
MSVREAASRVGVQVYHTGQGQDERARRRFPHLLRGLDSAWSGASTHTGSRERVAGCDRRWTDSTCSRGGSRSAERMRREPFGRLRWSTGSLHWRWTSQR